MKNATKKGLLRNEPKPEKKFDLFEEKKKVKFTKPSSPKKQSTTLQVKTTKTGNSTNRFTPAKNGSTAFLEKVKNNDRRTQINTVRDRDAKRPRPGMS